MAYRSVSSTILPGVPIFCDMFGTLWFLLVAIGLRV